MWGSWFKHRAAAHRPRHHVLARSRVMSHAAHHRHTKHTWAGHRPFAQPPSTCQTSGRRHFKGCGRLVLWDSQRPPRHSSMCFESLSGTLEKNKQTNKNKNKQPPSPHTLRPLFPLCCVVRWSPSGNPLVCILIYHECACTSNQLTPHTWQSCDTAFLRTVEPTFVYFVHRFVRHMKYNSYFRSILNILVCWTARFQEESVGQKSQTSLLKSMTNCLLDHPSFTAGRTVFCVHSTRRAVVRVHSTWRPAGERVSCFTALHTFIAL